MQFLEEDFARWCAEGLGYNMYCTAWIVWGLSVVGGGLWVGAWVVGVVVVGGVWGSMTTITAAATATIGQEQAVLHGVATQCPSGQYACRQVRYVDTYLGVAYALVREGRTKVKT